MDNQYMKEVQDAIVHTYNPFPVVLDHGKGAYLYDEEGNAYLDFAAGYAVCSLGYGNEEWNQALKAQIDKLCHTSNLYFHTRTKEAAQALKKLSGMDRIFFTNSGGEAVEGALKEVIRMGKLAELHMETVIEAVRTGSQKRVEKAFKIEQTMNEYEKQMAEYLAEVTKGSLTDHQRLVINNLLYTVSDIERISDHCDNIAELAGNMIEEGLSFSMDAMQGFNEITGLALDSVKAAVLARETEKMAYVQQVIQIEDEIDDMEEDLRTEHINRLARNECSAAKGVFFLDILSNVERIADHANNIVGYVADEGEE